MTPDKCACNLLGLTAGLISKSLFFSSPEPTNILFHLQCIYSNDCTDCSIFPPEVVAIATIKI